MYVDFSNVFDWYIKHPAAFYMIIRSHFNQMWRQKFDAANVSVVWVVGRQQRATHAEY